MTEKTTENTLTQTSIIHVLLHVNLHISTGSERGGTNVTHKLLFIETLSRNTETMGRLC